MSLFDAQEAKAEQSKNNDSSSDSSGTTELTERLSGRDEQIIAVSERALVNHIVENGNIPKNSPILEQLEALRARQKELYQSNEGKYGVSVSEYWDEMGAPEGTDTIEKDKFNDDGLFIHPDYSDDGRCYPDIPEYLNDLHISEGFEIADYHGSEESDTSEESDSQTVEVLSDLKRVGNKTEKSLRSHGFDSVEKVRNADPSELSEVEGVGPVFFEENGLTAPSKPEKDKKAPEENSSESSSDNSSSDDDNSLMAVVKANPEVIAELSVEQIEALK